MEQMLIYLVIFIVFVLCVGALVQWMGWTIPPVLIQIAGFIVIGILLVLVIRFLWPLLTGGSLRLGMIAPMLKLGIS